MAKAGKNNIIRITQIRSRIGYKQKAKKTLAMGDDYEPEDVEGLLSDRLKKGKERLDEAIETIKALCEPVEWGPPT